MRRFLCNRGIKLHLQMKILCCYVFSILLYEDEAWIPKQYHLKKMETFKARCNRRLWYIPWIPPITRIINRKVFSKVRAKMCEVLNIMKGMMIFEIFVFGLVLRITTMVISDRRTTKSCFLFSAITMILWISMLQISTYSSFSIYRFVRIGTNRTL